MPTKRNLLTTILFSVILLTGFSSNLNAQVAVWGGGSISSIRNETEIKNKELLINTHLGFSLQIYPFRNRQNLSVLAEPNINRKGYKQDFEQTYRFEFNYLSLPLLVNYSLTERFSINSGLEFSKLFSVNVRQGLKTYNHFDLGLVAGANYRLFGRLSIYSRFAYGLIPMLDYYEIDELGNFGREIHDLKNMSWIVGLKFNLNSEKIFLFR